MTDSPDTTRFSARLLLQDEPLTDAEIQEYRMKLENTLSTAERRKRLAGRVVVASFAVNLVLMFVGGSKIFGSFDPTDKDATLLSSALGVIYILAVIIFPLSLASYVSRFWPNVWRARQDLTDATMLELQREIRELRRQLESSSQPNLPNS
jgi:hypothetical protein